MRREAFGALAALGDGDLARALIGLVISSYRLRAPLSFPALASEFPRLFGERDGPGGTPLREATLPFLELQRYAASSRSRMGASAALEAWQLFAGGEQGPLTRYCVDLSGARNDPNRQIDLDWLMSLLGNESVRPASAFAAWPTESSSYEWEWPLRVGIAPGPSADELRQLVERSAQRSLLTIVDLTASGARCDIAMFSSSLRDAVRSAMEIPNVRASAALVLGGLSAPWSQAGPWLAGLRRQLHAGATSTCFVPAIERGIWFQGFIEELSHNKTLDYALFAAGEVGLRSEQAWSYPEAGAERPVLEPPLVLADREFLSYARMAETARRIAAAAVIASPAPITIELPYSWAVKDDLRLGRSLSLPEAGAAIASFAETLPWEHESGDATSLQQFRESVQSATGNALELPRIAVGMPVARRRSGTRSIVFGATSPPPRPAAFQTRSSDRPVARRVRGAPAAAGPSLPGAVPRPQAPRGRPPPRHVQLNVFRASDGARPALADPSTDYSVDVFVSPDRTGQVQANQDLDESTLPASNSGHQLRVAFTPLWRDSEGKIPPAQMLDMHLPAAGPSSTTRFHFRTPRSLTAFRARLIVMSQFRVLQTLLMHCTDGDGADGGAFFLTDENLVSANFGQDTIAPPFEAALVVNDSPLGVPGLTAIASGGVQFFEPAGLDILLKQLRDDLGTLNAPEETPGDKPEDVIVGLDDERIHDLMFRLALRGAALAKELRRQPLLGAFLSAPRLQVVDAVSGAFFPIELVYDGKAPLEGAQRCEHSIDALEDQSVHDACPNRKSSNHFCPAAFWGFSKCIERQPSNGQPGFSFSQPVVGSNSLRPLRNVLFAASQRVRQVDITPPAGMETIFSTAGIGFGLAKTWQDWTTQIGVATPSMLVLLPHSLNSAALADLPALEVGGGEVASVQLDESYVHGPGDERPVVLLLGCSTALADVPFLSFVREFRFNGAAVTIGTLATIRGRQTVEFVREFLAQLKQVAAEELTFDEAILRVKRRMLAKGDPFVLSLVAYGDTGWRVKS